MASTRMLPSDDGVTISVKVTPVVPDGMADVTGVVAVTADVAADVAAVVAVTAPVAAMVAVSVPVPVTEVASLVPVTAVVPVIADEAEVVSVAAADGVSVTTVEVPVVPPAPVELVGAALEPPHAASNDASSTTAPTLTGLWICRSITIPLLKWLVRSTVRLKDILPRRVKPPAPQA